MAKRHGGSSYLFAVNMTNKPSPARLTFAQSITGQAAVLEEKRNVDVNAGSFEDTFAPYAVHIYKVAGE